MPKTTSFRMPPEPRFCYDSPHVLAYRESVVRAMRTCAQKRALTVRDVARLLRVHPKQAHRIITGHVALDAPTQMYRWLKRLHPATTHPLPASIPPMTSDERKCLDRRMHRAVLRSARDPRPSIPAEKVFADLDARHRAKYPMSFLKPQGEWRFGRYIAIYAKDPDRSNRYYGKIKNRKSTVQFQASTLAGLERAFHRAVIQYEHFCKALAVPE